MDTLHYKYSSFGRSQSTLTMLILSSNLYTSKYSINTRLLLGGIKRGRVRTQPATTSPPNVRGQQYTHATTRILRGCRRPTQITRSRRLKKSAEGTYTANSHLIVLNVDLESEVRIKKLNLR